MGLWAGSSRVSSVGSIRHEAPSADWLIDWLTDGRPHLIQEEYMTMPCTFLPTPPPQTGSRHAERGGASEGGGAAAALPVGLGPRGRRDEKGKGKSISQEGTAVTSRPNKCARCSISFGVLGFLILIARRGCRTHAQMYVVSVCLFFFFLFQHSFPNTKTASACVAATETNLKIKNTQRQWTRLQQLPRVVVFQTNQSLERRLDVLGEGGGRVLGAVALDGLPVLDQELGEVPCRCRCVGVGGVSMIDYRRSTPKTAAGRIVPPPPCTYT